MNRSVIITGGSRGIGAECVRAFAANGDRVMFCYRSNTECAAALEEEIRSRGGIACGIMGDVTSREDISRIVSLCEYKFGGVDILINNAGIARQAVFDTIEPEDWDEMMAVNVRGCYLACRKVIPLMRNAGGGKIINISSMWGIAGASCEVHYSASKAAVIGMTRALAKELAPSHITVNCVAPGFITTDMNKALSEQSVRDIVEKTPLGRAGTPADISSAVLFLASDGASFITGQTICVDGGYIL